MNDLFRQFAKVASNALGSPYAFLAAAGLVFVWALAGPMLHFSQGWQMLINTGTTIVTFLMVFLIQNTQNRDARALHLKIDELILRLEGPRNELVELERKSDEELAAYEKEVEELCESEDAKGIAPVEPKEHPAG